jgi:phage tail sheath protein FI
MAVARGHPGVHVEEMPAGLKAITGVPTAIALFAGWSARGALDEAIHVRSFTEFEREFGGLDPRSLLGYSVKHFFDNGGSDAWVVRIAGAATQAGNDGTVLTPADDDFHAALLARFGVGSVTDRIDLFNLVCVPGLVHAPTLARLQAECRRRRAFLIIDADPQATVASMVSAGTRGLAGEDGTFSAIYFPWLRAVDPAQGGRVRDFPPCGFVAGVMARTDGSRGAWKAPAGSEASLAGALALSVPISDAQNSRLNPLGVNCLRTLPERGTVVWGARTLHGQDDRASEWKYIPVRRTALFIEESLHRGTRWMVFEPNDERLWAQVRSNVGTFMHDLWRQGVLQGSRPREACFVKCDRETMTQDDIDNGIVNILVGFAPLKPTEFLVLRIQQHAAPPPAVIRP